ncbi:hypothetical protein HY065_00510 [Candidatus Berkelbacteria bacterium]|nr:hypothetical protein [Candidatus Berkelbacteria bacterium]
MTQRLRTIALATTLTFFVFTPALAAAKTKSKRKKSDPNDLVAASRVRDPVVRDWARKQLGKSGKSKKASRKTVKGATTKKKPGAK